MQSFTNLISLSRTTHQEVQESMAVPLDQKLDIKLLRSPTVLRVILDNFGNFEDPDSFESFDNSDDFDNSNRIDDFGNFDSFDVSHF